MTDKNPVWEKWVGFIQIQYKNPVIQHSDNSVNKMTYWQTITIIHKNTLTWEQKDESIFAPLLLRLSWISEVLTID